MAVSKMCTVDGVSIIYSADTVDELVALIKAIEPDFNDGWIAHDGGEMPVSGDTLVQLKFRDGTVTDDTDDKANLFIWRHSDCVADIVAYRIVSEK